MAEPDAVPQKSRAGRIAGPKKRPHPPPLDSLMPWSDSVPIEVRLRPEAANEAAKMSDDPIIDIDPSASTDEEE